MRYNTYDNGGAVEGLVSISGMNLTGYLTLKGDPVGPLEAASRQYVLLKASSIKSSSVISGTFNRGRMPGFSGAAITIEGNNVTALANSGVLPGTYTKVTVNAGGIVTSASNLVSSDLPPMNWNKIVSGKPTTLEGYGITNGVDRNGGTITGNLTLFGTPFDDDDAATKAYVDGKGGAGDIYSVGDLVVGSYDEPPVGLLRCNGGDISKTSYSALYAAIGDKFSYIDQADGGKPWRYQYGFNFQTNPTLSFQLAGSLPYAACLTPLVVAKDRVYILGTYVVPNSQAAPIYTATIKPDGTLGAWTTTGSLPYAGYLNDAIIIKNRIYVFGGAINGTSSSYNVIQTAPINADGTIGTWTYNTGVPVNVYDHRIVATKSRVYLLGYGTVTYWAPINEDGTLGSWTTGTSHFEYVWRTEVVIIKNKIYTIGGGTDAGGVSNKIQVADIDSNGVIGTWSNLALTLPYPLYSTRAVVTKDKLYLFGGHNGSVQTKNILTAPINADGTIGTWTTLVNELPVAGSYINTLVTSNNLYLLNIFNGYNATADFYVSSFNGGLNNYSDFNEGSLIVTNPNDFRLPDYTSLTNPTGNIYVKY